MATSVVLCLDLSTFTTALFGQSRGKDQRHRAGQTGAEVPLAARPTALPTMDSPCPCRLCISRKRNQSRSHRSRQSALSINFGGDTARRHRRRPAGIERELGNNLSYLVFRDAVVERPAEVTL